MSDGWKQLNVTGRVLAGFLLTLVVLGAAAGALILLWAIIRVVSLGWHLAG